MDVAHHHYGVRNSRRAARGVSLDEVERISI